jgi:hypothetical protein
LCIAFPKVEKLEEIAARNPVLPPLVRLLIPGALEDTLPEGGGGGGGEAGGDDEYTTTMMKMMKMIA